MSRPGNRRDDKPVRQLLLDLTSQREEYSRLSHDGRKETHPQKVSAGGRACDLNYSCVLYCESRAAGKSMPSVSLTLRS